MSLSLAGSYHAPASSMQTLAPARVSTWAAIPPPAPEPTTITSYDFGALTCGIAPFYLGTITEEKRTRAILRGFWSETKELGPKGRASCAGWCSIRLNGSQTLPQ